MKYEIIEGTNKHIEDRLNELAVKHGLAVFNFVHTEKGHSKVLVSYAQ